MRVLALAVALDLIAGDPPSRYHPVAWLGWLIAAGQRLATSGARRDLALHGTVLLLVVVEVAVAGALVSRQAVAALPAPLALLLEAWLLKCTFALRGLFAAVELVRGHLVAGDLVGARGQLGRHLVSRPTGDLDPREVAGAAVESLAENLTDGFVAPICFFVAGSALGGDGGGLVAAWAYRAVNTADSMIGYRQGDLEDLGRASARTDDALNFVPARLSAWALVAGAWLSGQSARGARSILARDGRRTESPNAGQTMAAMAGALGIALEKRGQYRLGDGALADVNAIDRALRVERWSAALCLAGTLLLLAILR